MDEFILKNMRSQIDDLKERLETAEGNIRCLLNDMAAQVKKSEAADIAHNSQAETA